MQPTGHGGDLRRLAAAAGRPPESILDFSANINPLGPPAWLPSVVRRALDGVVHYPDPACTALREAAARRYGVCPDEILAGNGSTELLFLLCAAAKRPRALLPVPSYIDYAAAARQAGMEIRPFLLREDDGFAVDCAALETAVDDASLVLLGQPNNPTGRLVDATALRALARRHPETRFLVDEAFLAFAEDADTLVRDRPANVTVLVSLTKIYAIPGLRLGIAVGDREMLRCAAKRMPPWSVNGIAQAVGAAALEDADYVRRSVRATSEWRNALLASLAALPGLRPFPGAANYLLLRIDDASRDAPALADALLREEGIAVRVCDNYEGLDRRFLRVAVRSPEENERLVAALARRLLPSAAPAVRTKRPQPRLMVQGVCSNAGKSVLAAAFCRLLLRDGLAVVPFKAQNMALNSFVTRDGGEMGRAQVVQAQACRREPDVRMNPVLLKPSSDTGSQVVVLGRPVDTMDVKRYAAYKRELFPTVCEAFDSLAAEADAVVLEGAGSPAEVNLKDEDITNMRMAHYAASPVLIVGDIDRGGVYASFLGTLDTFARWERELVAGFVVNKFRGDASLLAPAHDFVRRATGLSVLGVVPYLHDIQIPDEDSVTLKGGGWDRPGATRDDAVEIAVADLAHISNFTDFEPLRREPDVHLRFVRHARELGEPDAILLPGSKNVLGDLEDLRARGFAEALGERGAEIVGICGGFQMLGRRIADPHGLESARREAEGLARLPVETTLAREKDLRRTTARHTKSGLPLTGYEIHHGQTTVGGEATPAVVREDGMVIGVAGADGRVWGTYLHGLFDEDRFRRWWIDRLRTRKGLAPLGTIQAAYDVDAAIDRLADTVAAAVDWPAIRAVMGL